MTVIVVSPHLDDAVLSVPGLVRAHAMRGERVVVLTVFSEGDARHELRRREDRTAVARLGAEPLHLGLRDGPWRRGVPQTFRGLVLAELPAGDLDAIAVADVLAARVASLAPEAVLLPLGVGEHIDHRVVHAAHRRIAARVGFYEDRPYALVRYAVEARLARLGATVDGAPIAPSRTRAAELLAAARTAPYVCAYVPVAERDACLGPLAEPLALPAPESGLVLRRQTHVFDAAALAAAAHAGRAYASQLADLFGAADVDLAAALAGSGARYEEHLYSRVDPGPEPGDPARGGVGA